MRKHLKHPLSVGIIGGALATIITTPIVAIMNKIKWDEALSLIFSTIGNWILAILNFNIKLWWLLVAGIILFFIVKWIITREQDSPTSSIQNYRSDVIDGILWNWEWYRNYSGHYTLSSNSLSPICNHCKTDLRETRMGYGSGLTCSYCHFSKHIEDIDNYYDKIGREIIRRVRTGEYKKEAG